MLKLYEESFCLKIPKPRELERVIFLKNDKLEKEKVLYLEQTFGKRYLFEKDKLFENNISN